jgi:hypothetical protein
VQKGKPLDFIRATAVPARISLLETLSPPHIELLEYGFGEERPQLQRTTRQQSAHLKKQGFRATLLLPNLIKNL